MKTLAILPLILVLAFAARSDAQQINAEGDSMSVAPVVRSVVNYSGGADVIAVYGKSEPQPGYGMGAFFQGGYVGNYAGTTNAPQSSFPSYAIYALNQQAGTTERYGIYSSVNNPGATQVAGYFDAIGANSYGLFANNPADSGYAAYFNGHLRVIANENLGIGFNGITVDHPTVPNILSSIMMTYSTMSDSAGFSLFARDEDQGGGINLGETDGFAYQSIYAQDFLVISDERLKTEVEYILANNSNALMSEFRDLKAARFRYDYGDHKSGVQYGIIAQSAPIEILGETSERSDGRGEARLAVKLASWLGLVTIAAQENDRRLTELEMENERLRKENASILRRLEALEKKIE